MKMNNLLPNWDAPPARRSSDVELIREDVCRAMGMGAYVDTQPVLRALADAGQLPMIESAPVLLAPLEGKFQ